MSAATSWPRRWPAITAPSANPALGLRAIRLSLKERALLDAQLGAMLRAAVHGPVRILLPMISIARRGAPGARGDPDQVARG